LDHEWTKKWTVPQNGRSLNQDEPLISSTLPKLQVRLGSYCPLHESIDAVRSTYFPPLDFPIKE